jgi:hypothetical protein
VFALAAAGATACFGSPTDGSSEDGGSVTVSASPELFAVNAGGSANIAVSVSRQAFDKALTLSAHGACGTIFVCQPLPAGITATFDPGTLSGTVLSSRLTLTAALDAPPTPGTEPVPVMITATYINKGDSIGGSAGVALRVLLPAVVVTRNGTGSGTVTSNPPGIGCGSTCTGRFATGTNVTLTASAASGSAFAGWSGGCTGTSATCTVTIGSPTTNVTATFNSTAPGFSLAVTQQVSVPQGGSGTASVNITRMNGFSGAVTLAVSGAPAELTVTPNPESVAGDAATIDVAPPLSLAAGNYPLTLTATGTDVASQTATFHVQVTPAPDGSGNVAFSFATCDPTQVPIWFAVQNGGGAWTPVVPATNNSFTFPVSGPVGIAYVQESGTSFSTTVLYASGPEFTQVAIGDVCRGQPQTGTKRLHGTMMRVALPPVFATVTIGGAVARYESGHGTSYMLPDVPSGTRDLFAAVLSPNPTSGLTPVSRIILRRNVNFGDDATIPTLDFGSTEYFAPARGFLTINNLGADVRSVSEAFVTANGTTAPFHEDTFTDEPMTRYFAVPDSLLQPSDLHVIQINALPAGPSPSSARFVLMLLHSATDQTITLGPPLTMPTVTSVAASPYPRLRAQLPSQSAYNAAASAEFRQNDNLVEIFGSAAYFGGTPPNWTLEVPDLTAAGYDPAWGLRSGTPVDWGVGSITGDFLVVAGATLVDGAQMVGAEARGTLSAP